MKFAKLLILLFVFTSILSLGIHLAMATPENLFDAFGVKLESVAGEKGAGYNIQATPEGFISLFIQIALSFLGVIFLILTIYGGYLWMTAHGNEEQVGKAKNVITAAIIGLVIVISAYAISVFVISKLGKGALTTMTK